MAEVIQLTKYYLCDNCGIPIIKQDRGANTTIDHYCSYDCGASAQPQHSRKQNVHNNNDDEC